MQRRGQPLEAEALLEAVRLHLDDAVSAYRGRTDLRDGIDADDYRLGLPPDLDERLPDRPIDGLGRPSPTTERVRQLYFRSA
ncbi:hypothetical protein BRC88_13505 [Halobacteriales archaeon QS_4_69_225]|nr:MAG: hypothetical protein BRC88_13505 [Halobacteriales archaeon QS_4_69_225]